MRAGAPIGATLASMPNKGVRADAGDGRAIVTGRHPSEVFIPNVALALLRSLPDSCTPLTFFDPQHRAVLDKLAFGNEGARQRERCKLPAMSDACCREIARVLALTWNEGTPWIKYQLPERSA